MAVPVIYLVIILAYLGLMFSFFIKDMILMIMASFMLFALSVFVFMNGLHTFPVGNFITVFFAAVTFAVAAYTSIRGGLEMMGE